MLSEEQIKMHLSAKLESDRLRINYLFDEDLEVCNYVLNQIPYIDVKSVISGGSISLNELIQMSLEEMTIFGDEVYLKTQQIISKVPICREYDYFLKYRTSFGFDIVNGNVDDKSGIVDRYIIPKDTYDLSIFLLCHEHIHALKDINYYECRDTLREVIPLFYELIVFDPDDVLTKELMKCRMSWLLGNRNNFNMYNNLMNNKIVIPNLVNMEEEIFARGGLYDYLRLNVGVYLNGFYYAMILYSMFKETPKKILDLVSKVLRGEMTTLMMLDVLGIYGDIRGEIFEKELGNIRKLLK